MKSDSSRKTLGVVGAGTFACLLIAAANAAQATVITGSSGASTVQVDVSVSGLENDISVRSPSPEFSFSAPDPYNQQSSVLKADANAAFDGSGVSFSGTADAAALTTTASSNVTGTQAIGSASASSTIKSANVSFSLFGPLFDSLLGGFGAEVITSSASVSGSFGNLQASGSSTITGVDGFLKTALADLSFNGTIEAAPNTNLGLDIFGVLGLNLFLNEQLLTGDGESEKGITVNALRLQFDAISLFDLDLALGVDNTLCSVGQTTNSVTGLLGVSVDTCTSSQYSDALLSGQIILGQSFASLTARPVAVPVPATAPLLGIGLLGLMLAARRRRSAED